MQLCCDCKFVINAAPSNGIFIIMDKRIHIEKEAGMAINIESGSTVNFHLHRREESAAKGGCENGDCPYLLAASGCKRSVWGNLVKLLMEK